MATISQTSRPAFVYDADTDTWIPVGIGPHTHTTNDVTNIQAYIDNNNILVIMGAI